MSTNEDGSIYKFTEKPQKPESTKASMGIYIFNKKKLFEYLIADEADPDSSNDFGKNIIPTMLAAGEKLFAYPFKGYWKDVGTIQSLWEANMDLLGKNPKLSLFDESWRIFSRHIAYAPQYISGTARVYNSSITEGCEIYGTVRNCVLGTGVKVMEGAAVCDSVIMSDVVIEPGAQVNYSIVDSGVTVGKNATVGEVRNVAREITVIGAGINIAEGQTVKEGEMLSD